MNSVIRDIRQFAAQKSPIVTECFIISLYCIIMLVVGVVFIALLSSYRPTPVVRTAPQILLVAGPVETSIEPAPEIVQAVTIPAPAVPRIPVGPIVHWVEFHVQSGDTFERIARRYCLDYVAVARENGIKDPNWIYAGKTVLNFKNGCVSNAPSVLVKQSVSPRELVSNGRASSGKRISSLAPRDTEARKLPSATLRPRTTPLVSAPVPSACASILAARKPAADYEILDCIQREYATAIRTASQASRLEPPSHHGEDIRRIQRQSERRESVRRFPRTHAAPAGYGRALLS